MGNAVLLICIISFVLAPSFLPSSQEYTAICRCSHSKPSSSANNLSDSCTSLLFFKRVLFCIMMDSTFSISSIDLIASICIWKVLFTSGLFPWFICSIRKDILSSIICCRVVIIYGEAKLQMDCYIIASTLGGGWGFSNYEKKEGRIDEGRRGRREGRGNFIRSSTLNVYQNDTLANESEKFIERHIQQ